MNRFILTDNLPSKLILTDDPFRVKMIVAHYLDNVEELYEQRGMIGYKGSYSGCELAAIACGFGETAANLYLSEAIALNVKEVVYLGECITLSDENSLMDVILAVGGSNAIFQRALRVKTMILNNSKIHIMPTHTNDRFWSNGLFSISNNLKIIDFATHAVYKCAKKHDIEAISLLTVTENNFTQERVADSVRQSRLTDAIVMALETLIAA